MWSGKAGSGIVIARLEDGSWSAPSCIATGGVGFGLQVGADFSELCVGSISQFILGKADLNELIAVLLCSTLRRQFVLLQPQGI